MKKNRSSLFPCKIAIVSSRFNDRLVAELKQNCIVQLHNNEIPSAAITEIEVPGAFEIPLATKALLETTRFDAVITLGVIIRGETPHFDYIAENCARSISILGLEYLTPVIFGVLTTDSAIQAEARVAAEQKNKGREVAEAALEMIRLMRSLHTKEVTR